MHPHRITSYNVCYTKLLRGALRLGLGNLFAVAEAYPELKANENFQHLQTRISDNIASIYAAKAGGTTEDWRSAMLAESWYSAEEAIAAGRNNFV